MNHQFECLPCNHSGGESKFVVYIFTFLYVAKYEMFSVCKFIHCPICDKLLGMGTEQLDCGKYV